MEREYDRHLESARSFGTEQPRNLWAAWVATIPKSSHAGRSVVQQSTHEATAELVVDRARVLESPGKRQPAGQYDGKDAQVRDAGNDPP